MKIHKFLAIILIKLTNICFVNSMMSVPSVQIISSDQLSFRKTLLFYLKTNAKSRLLLKLMEVSRYFCFKEFPYMVVKGLRYLVSEWEYESLGYYKRLDLDNLTKPLWIYNGLYLYNGADSNLISHLLSKTAVCDVKTLYIAWQHLKIDELQILISSNAVEDIDFCETEFVYDDGSVVPVEKIVKMLPNFKKFKWTFNDASPEINPTSIAKIIEQLNPSILTHFELGEIPEAFNFKLFAEFMDQNPLILFHLQFNGQIPDEYAKTLQAYIDKLIKNNEFKNRKILIEFPQQNEEYFDIMQEHFWYA